MTTVPVLRIANTDKPFMITIDASNTAIGAVLLQADQNGHQHPVVFIFCKLTSAEQNYPVHERELLAIIYAFQKW